MRAEILSMLTAREEAEGKPFAICLRGGANRECTERVFLYCIKNDLMRLYK